MDRLYSHLKMQCKVNKMILTTMMIFAAIGVAAIIWFNINELSANIAHDLPALPYKNHSEISFITLFITLTLFLIPLYSIAGFSNSIQLSIRMGSTRKYFLFSYITFYTLISFIWSFIIILLLVIEHYLYMFFRTTQIIDIYNIISFGSLSFISGIKIFLFYFSTLICLLGLLCFIYSIISSIFSGKIIVLIVSILFFTTYLAIIMTSFKVTLENFLLSNPALMLNIKLLILGISSFILSWPFIERIDIDKMRFK